MEKIVPIEVDEVDNSAMHLKFPPCLRSGDYPIIAESLKKVYPSRLHRDGPGQTVFEGVDLTIKRGEKVAFVGKNGEGKSTFMSIVTGKMQPDEGKVEWSKYVTAGYLDQHSVLEEGQTVRECLTDRF